VDIHIVSTTPKNPVLCAEKTPAAEMSFGVAALLLSLVSSACGAFSTERYATKFVMQDSSTGTLGVDFSSAARSRFSSEGRAGAVVVTQSAQMQTSSYPAANFTYQVTLGGATDGNECANFQANAQLELFDLSSRGWLSASSTTRTPLAGGATLYVGAVPLNSMVMTSSNNFLQASAPYYVSLLVNSHGVPTSLNCSSQVPPIGDIAQMAFSHFEFDPYRLLHDSDFAPPPNDCYAGGSMGAPFICSGNPVKTIDVYRTHDNDTWATILFQENGADATGEAYYLSQMTPHPFITHFRVALNTTWVPYCECNGGTCSSYVAGIPSNYNSLLTMMQGVGREEGLGGVQRMDGTGQCDAPTVVSPQGYWYSFPRFGECEPHAQVGHNNCTWAATRVKTVTLACAQALMTGSTAQQQGKQLEQAFVKCPSQQMQPHN
jgi:hypothetical protein